MHVLIEKGDVEERRFGERVFHTQTGFLVTAEEKKRMEISLPRGHNGYPPGRYSFAESCFDLDQYKRPIFTNRGLDLVPIKTA